MAAGARGVEEALGLVVHETSRFFDEMAPSYDADLVELGWDPIALLRRWPFVVPPGSTVLDVGCGTGALLEHLAGAGRTLVGIDASPGMIARARQRKAVSEAALHVVDADAAWPIFDATIDAAFSLAMLEFVEHLDRALDELQRVLRVGGTALITSEDRIDATGVEREPFEMRYDRFGLWRRTAAEIEECVPPGLDIVRHERTPGYLVEHRGFRCAYHVVELVRNDRV